MTGRNRGHGRKHVKSGCGTCKIRKIKCDEAKPACHKCVSTGRVCDGYGIWGGGGHSQSLTNVPACKVSAVVLKVPVPRPTYMPVLAGSPDEKEIFAWFKHRTSVKLPGSFPNEFWGTLLLQGSLSEPAVFHAVLALSSVHRGGILGDGSNSARSSLTRACERSALQHYGQAIRHLQSHFSVRDRWSFRITLITCLVFVAMDLLRGHFATAYMHYRSGLRLFLEMQSISDADGKPSNLQRGQQTSDDWIEEAFGRLYIHMQLFQHMSCPSRSPLQFTRLQLQTFSSFREAWREMDWLLNEIFDLGQQARDLEGDMPSHEMLSYQRGIQGGLERWLGIYQASKEVLIGRETAEKSKAYWLLRVYHDLATIMADVCLYPHDESVFDVHDKEFTDLLKQFAFLWLLSSRQDMLFPPGQDVNMSRSITDVGWIAPLYYTAVKCRVHRVRLQAIRLLESSSSREGIWDSRIAALVARKVMEVEEGDYYKNADTRDDFPATCYPKPEDLCLPTLPLSRRIRDVEMTLLGNPLDRISVRCTRIEDGVDRRVCIGEYHVASQNWQDIYEV